MAAVVGPRFSDRKADELFSGASFLSVFRGLLWPNVGIIWLHCQKEFSVSARKCEGRQIKLRIRGLGVQIPPGALMIPQ
jgi:hypothetical protein